MNIGVLKETKTLEKRVAIIPSTVKDLTKKGYTFCVEKDAGNLSHYSNQSFTSFLVAFFAGGMSYQGCIWPVISLKHFRHIPSKISA